MPYDYDVALSFAGEDREYVESIAIVLHSLGVKVFYDRYYEVDLWGKDLYSHLDDVYRNKAQYCVMFVSEHYRDKVWCNHERASAQARAMQEIGEYILPVRIDSTDIPGLRPTVGYISATMVPSEKIAQIIAQKVDPSIDLTALVTYLESWLREYVITVKGTNISFQCDVEDFYAEFPLRLLLEMYRLNMLYEMFLMPAIVPW